MKRIKLVAGKYVHSAFLLLTGMTFGLVANFSGASLSPPDEHKGLSVNTLGEVGHESFDKQLGLAGYKLQLRAITIAPGGQIARHSHANRPGLVKVVSGTWTEGRPQGEFIFNSDSAAMLEDSNTDHWVFNLGDEPATAYVCDIVADGS